MFGTERSRVAAAGALALICGLLLLIPGLPGAITFPAAVPLVLVLPGYAVTRALFGRRLELVEQVTLTVGLSLSIAVLGGLFLNLRSQGLSLPQWGGLLAGITIVASGLAWLRGAPAGSDLTAGSDVTATEPLGADERSADLLGLGADGLPPAGSTPAAKRIPRTQLAMLGLAGLLLLASLGVARLGAAVQHHETFSELWMVPSVTGTFVDLGFTNDESRSTTYRLLVTLDGRTIGEWTDVVLADGGSWEQRLLLNFRRDTHRIQATLYRTGDVEAYRETHADIRYRPNAGQVPLPSATASGAPAASPAASSPASSFPTTPASLAP